MFDQISKVTDRTPSDIINDTSSVVECVLTNVLIVEDNLERLPHHQIDTSVLMKL